jgi:hypothetical protein
MSLDVEVGVRFFDHAPIYMLNFPAPSHEDVIPYFSDE